MNQHVRKAIQTKAEKAFANHFKFILSISNLQKIFPYILRFLYTGMSDTTISTQKSISLSLREFGVMPISMVTYMKAALQPADRI